MSGAVWQPNTAPRSRRPADSLTRALRPVLLAVCGDNAPNQVAEQTLRLSLDDIGDAVEVRLRASMTGAGKAGQRDTAEYRFAGSLLAPGGWVSFKGSATVDVGTMAYLRIEAALG